MSNLLLAALEAAISDLRRLQERSDLLDRLLDLMRTHPQATGADLLDAFEEWEAENE